MKLKMPKPSNQLIFSAAASVLALSALALASGSGHDHSSGSALAHPLQAGFELPGLPILPTLLPR